MILQLRGLTGARQMSAALFAGPFRYAVGLSMPLMMLCSMWGTVQFPGQNWICIAPILFCFAVIPLLDIIFGRDTGQHDVIYAKVIFHEVPCAPLHADQKMHAW